MTRITDKGVSLQGEAGNHIINIDSTTQTLQTISYEHYKIHSGDTYCLDDIVDLAINNVRDIQITTPNTTNWAHLYFNIHTESETNVYLYENVNIILAGSLSPVYNSNRNSSNTADLIVKIIDNTSLANANLDTDVSAALQIHHIISGAGKDAGEHNHAHEIILKQNEDYCIRFIANAAGYVNYHLDWYEHTNV